MAMSRLCSAVLAAMVLTVLAAGPANATIPRVRGSWLFGPAPVWTDGTANPSFRPLSEPMESKSLLSVRVSTEMSEDSGNCKMRPALRYSNDGVTWDAPKEIVSTYRTTEGTDWGTVYIDITQLAGTASRAYVQFGVEVANEAGSAINICNATIRVEPKEPVR